MLVYTVKVNDNGDKYWYLNGERHREDGPAIEYHDGTKYWYLNGGLHREDGPAVIYPDGVKKWYLNDRQLTESEFLKRTSKNVEMSIEEIKQALNINNLKIIKG